MKADDECSQLGGPKLTACIIYQKLTLSRASRWFIREWEGNLSRACALATAARSSPSRCQLLHCRLAASPEPLHDCTRVYVNSGYRRADRENIGTGAQSMECGIVATCAETTCVQRKGNKQVGLLTASRDTGKEPEGRRSYGSLVEAPLVSIYALWLMLNSGLSLVKLMKGLDLRMHSESCCWRKRLNIES